MLRNRQFPQKDNATSRFEEMATAEKTIDIQIDMEEGEPLGATPNDKLVITKIQSGTIAEGKLRVSTEFEIWES